MVSDIYDVSRNLLTVDNAKSATGRVEDCNGHNIIICIVINRGIVVDPENQDKHILIYCSGPRFAGCPDPAPPDIRGGLEHVARL